MSRKIHLDNLMRARLKKMVDAAMPEYQAVQALNAKLEPLLIRAIGVIERGDFVDREAFLIEAKMALGLPVPTKAEAA